MDLTARLWVIAKDLACSAYHGMVVTLELYILQGLIILTTICRFNMIHMISRIWHRITMHRILLFRYLMYAYAIGRLVCFEDYEVDEVLQEGRSVIRVAIAEFINNNPCIHLMTT